MKLLHVGIIYPVSHSEWVSPVQVVPKKGGMTVVKNEKNELIPQITITGCRMCNDYQKLNKATKKYHFPLPFIDEMLERLANHSFFCFCLHQNLEEESQGLKSSQDHVIKGSIVCRSKLADSNAALESSFFRQRQQITTKATNGAGTRPVGLYKKGKIRVQVISN